MTTQLTGTEVETVKDCILTMAQATSRDFITGLFGLADRFQVTDVEIAELAAEVIQDSAYQSEKTPPLAFHLVNLFNAETVPDTARL